MIRKNRPQQAGICVRVKYLLREEYLKIERMYSQFVEMHPIEILTFNGLTDEAIRTVGSFKARH
jgi:hypothetical protein